MSGLPEKVHQAAVELTDEEAAELEAAIDEADRDGGGILAAELLRELRAKYDQR